VRTQRILQPHGLSLVTGLSRRKCLCECARARMCACACVCVCVCAGTSRTRSSARNTWRRSKRKRPRRSMRCGVTPRHVGRRRCVASARSGAHGVVGGRGDAAADAGRVASLGRQGHDERGGDGQDHRPVRPSECATGTLGMATAVPVEYCVNSGAWLPLGRMRCVRGQISVPGSDAFDRSCRSLSIIIVLADCINMELRVCAWVSRTCACVRANRRSHSRFRSQGTRS
jgi:hypothetical protein